MLLLSVVGALSSMVKFWVSYLASMVVTDVPPIVIIIRLGRRVVYRLVEASIGMLHLWRTPLVPLLAW